MKKKNTMKKWVTNNITFFALILVLSACGELSIAESNFSKSNLTEFNFANITSYGEDMSYDELKEFLKTIGKSDDDIQNYLNGDWYYHSWESESDLTAFTILWFSGCESQLYYYTFLGSDFISEKIIASSTECGDYEQRISSTKSGNTFSISRYAYGYGDTYPFNSQEDCIVTSEGKFECEKVINLYPGVSLWNGLALRETPDKKGKYITLVNIGETFTTTDSIDVNEEDEYLHVSLKDGSAGYIINRLVMQKAVPMAILRDASIYRRPDNLTKTSDAFYAMDIVGYSEMEGEYEWFKVKGRPEGSKWFKEGWIKSDNSTQNPIDIAVASLVKKAMEEKDEIKRFEMLEAIQSNQDFSSSQLIDHLNYILQ
ncbi:MAG: hypothetical protein GY816_18365 [Cytophagales bacterium]|nr:hypothetical protein [Cytophagales bacterium]